MRGPVSYNTKMKKEERKQLTSVLNTGADSVCPNLLGSGFVNSYNQADQLLHNSMTRFPSHGNGYSQNTETGHPDC